MPFIFSELCQLIRVLFCSPQMDDVFAAGDLGEALKAVEAMEAAGLEAADARDKLTRVMTAVKKVRDRSLINMILRTVSLYACS